MDDLISRQAAIDAVHRACNYFDICDYKGVGCKQIYALKTMPSADRPKGKWIHDNSEECDRYSWQPWYCSNCGVGIGKHPKPFCPHCGADMRGVDDESTL